MTRTIVLTALIAAAFATPVKAAERSEATFRDRYGTLAQQNLFMRNRAPRERPSFNRERPSAPPPPIESRFVLTGIVEEGHAYRAHIEDRSGNAQLTLAPGDSVADGKITQITLDGAVYEARGEQTRVAVGQNLLGEAGSVPTPTPATATSTSAAAPNTTDTAATGAPSENVAPATPGSPGTPANPATLSIEERMRLRRQQEVK